MKKLAQIKADFMELSLPIGLAIIAATPELPIIFTNDMFAKMLGFDDVDEFIKENSACAWNLVYPEERESLKSKAISRLGNFEPYEISYRAIKKDGSCIWVNQNSRHTQDENGNEIIFAYYTDITMQKLMEEEVLAGARKYEILINSIPGGVGMYRWDDSFTPIFVSDGVYALCGMTKEEYCEVTKHSTLDIFHPDDAQGLIDAVQEAYKGDHKFEYTHRVLQKSGDYHWMRVSGQLMELHDGTKILYTVFTDLHEQIQTEHALRESEFRYATAIKASNINIWEYDYATDVMTIFSKSPKVNPSNLVIPNYLNSVVEEGHIREDSAVLLYDMIEKLKQGEKEVTSDLWIRDDRDDDFWCERVTYSNIFDESGKPVRAYCVGHDVTKEKEAEKRYREELSYREAMQKATVASVNVNLTRNTIMDYKSVFPAILRHMNTSKTAQEYFETVYTALTTEEMQKKCAAVFNRDALLRSFANGETTLSMELTRNIEGRIYWTILTAHMMKKVEDNEIVAFLYSTDLTNERTMQNVMNAIVTTDYDFLVVVDGLRNSAVRYSKKNLNHAYLQETDNFEGKTQEYIRNYICKNDVTRVVEEITIKNILEKLGAHKTYSIFYSVLDLDGNVLQKQLRFSYINRELRSFLMTRTDITAAVEEQKRKNQELVAAVKMAEQANAAKSEFLSRISHEIRTPMNAIIGMSQIALQSLDDQKLARESIEKSLYASQYLLLLLNDILDMSRIESGKVTLKKELIFCDKILDAIDTIIGTQALAKGVEYSVTEFNGRKSTYIGDPVRLQQILINILSNAVKFTPQGGKVNLDVSQVGSDEKHADICFKISDTGIGISKDFLPNMFKPFSQEHIGSTSGYGGSGLGLAISKNIARLMGGDISVESTLGKGTTFIVNIPFEFSENTTKKCVENCKRKCPAEYDFTGKKILLVEDHQLNIIVAKKLLEFKNAEVDVAINGKIGLEKFTEAPEHHYNAVLMDIRMPVMDGLESAQKIRSLDSAWAKVVPIIAMSANAFDEDVIKSKNAGMNAHLAKPIDSELFYHTLFELLAKEGGYK